MDPKSFCAASHVMLVVGKGGVGRTTISAAVAKLAADQDLRVLLVDVEGRGDVGQCFGDTTPLSYSERRLYNSQKGRRIGEVWARTITPDDALVEWLEDHGLRAVARRLASTGAVDIVATGVPGIRDLLVLGKIKNIERKNTFDVIVVDAAASGHAVSFLASAYGLQQVTSVGPIRSQANDVVDFLADRRRARVLLVTIPEETPVQETLDTITALQARTSVHIAGLIVNQTWHAEPELISAVRKTSRESPLVEAGIFRKAIAESQAEELRELMQRQLLPKAELPSLFQNTPQELVSALADSIAEGVGEW